MTENLPETMTGEKPEEYSGPQVIPNGEGKVELNFKWDSYILTPDGAEEIAEQIDTDISMTINGEKKTISAEFQFESYSLSEEKAEQLANDLKEAAEKAREE